VGGGSADPTAAGGTGCSIDPGGVEVWQPVTIADGSTTNQNCMSPPQASAS
jgi:hypothetical protein